MTRTSNTTGIGVRGGTAQLGGISTQPLPFVVPSTFPVSRQTNPITSVIAPSNITDALTNGLTPELSIPVVDIVTGNIPRAVREVIPPILNSVQYRPVTEPTIRMVLPILTPIVRPNDETLSLSHLSVDNNQYQLIDPHGISQLRPEIIGLMDYEPIYFSDSMTLNDVGILMDVQYQARHLREQTFFQLMAGIQQSDKNQELQNLQSEFSSGFHKINSSADFYKNTITTLENVKNGFDIKGIPNKNFNLTSFKTLRDFYENFMLFPKEAFDSFASTKVIMQLLFDMRSIAEGYSMNLLNLTDPDRLQDGNGFTNPIAIDKSYNTRNGFSFSYDTIRSFNNAVNATEGVFFTRFNTSLPTSPDDRVKLLINMVSKELRVSRALGRNSILADLQQKFGATTVNGSPFDNLIGGVGNTIFEPVTGPGSLASLTVVNDNTKTAILPFETKYIDSNGTDKVYIPGSSYFVDSIINVESLNSFNLAPLREYVESFITTTDNVTSVVNGLFDYGTTTSPLSPVALFKQLLYCISTGLTGLMSNPQRGGDQLNSADAAVAAIFRLATTDPTLKSMLFQYVTLHLFYGSTSRYFTTKIAGELHNDIRNLDKVTVNSTYELPSFQEPNSLRDFANELARSIQNRVMELVNQHPLRGHGNNATSRLRRNTASNNGRTLVGLDIDVRFGMSSILNQSHFIYGFGHFITGLETLVGNEMTNVWDSQNRTRFNSISSSTILLMVFEAYSSLILKYVDANFQSSSDSQNLPDILVDTTFNAQMKSSFDEIIAEPELPLPVGVSSHSSTSSTPRNAQTQRSNRSNRRASVNHVYDQINQTARTTGQSDSETYNGITGNEAILGGPMATAGSTFTHASQLALRRLSNHSNQNDLLDAHDLDRSLDSIAFKLFQEDFSIACAMHILLVIKQQLKKSLDLATNFFNRETLNNFAALNGTSLSDIGKNLTPIQVKLLLRQRDSYVKQLTNNSNQIQFIPNSSTDQDVRNVIGSLLSNSRFRETNEASLRYKLLTVGLPSGFSKNLTDRLNTSSLSRTSFEQNKATNLVCIKVYKRSLEYPLIQFKPRKFLFDLSLFPNGYTNLNIQPAEGFSSVLRRITLVDYQNFSNPTNVTLDSIVNSDKYSILSGRGERQNLFENHVLSDIFASYIQALTTMKLTEETFVNTQSSTWRNLSIGDGTDLSPRFAELVRQFIVSQRNVEIRRNPSLRPLPNISIQEMLTHPNVDQHTKDTLKLLSFGNIAFKPENAIAGMLSPKVFERVFTIPLNVDEFEIDYENVINTESSREFFQKDFIQNKLDPTTPQGVYRFKPRTHKDTVFEDYFVTIELVQ